MGLLELIDNHPGWVFTILIGLCVLLVWTWTK
jgi:hypothetical protein